MNFFNVLTMLGGLALFLYGMHIMGDGLAKMSGGKLEMILEKFTAKPITAVLLGAGVTAVIQSSSASVGILQALASTGMIPLSSAVFVLFGQNIGTCITAVLASIGMKVNAKRTTDIHLLFNRHGIIYGDLSCDAVCDMDRSDDARRSGGADRKCPYSL